VFGVGYQSIPIFTWLFYPLAIYYTRLCWWNLVSFFIVNLFGNALAFLGSFNLNPTSDFANVGLLIGIYGLTNDIMIVKLLIS
jgi:hypothetical protein